MKKEKFRHDYFLILMMFLFIVLRFWRLQSDLLFHRDQGLHAIDTWQIWHDHKLRLLGQPTDVDGIFHGSLYYHLLSIPYFLSHGDPFAAVSFQIVIELISLPFLYLGVTKLFDKKTARLSLFFYTISHLLIGYSRWLNNVPPILPAANFLIYLLSLQLKSWSSKRFFLIGLITGLVAQLDGAMAFSLVPTLLFIFRKKLNFTTTLLFVFGILIPAIPQLLFEVRHNFVITHAIINLFRHKNQGINLSPLPFIQSLSAAWTQVGFLLSYKFLILSLFLLSFGIFNLHKTSKATRVLVWSYFLIPVLTYGFLHRGAIGFFFIYTWPLILAVVSFGILNLPTSISTLFVVLIVFINFYWNISLLSPNSGLTPIGTSNLTTLQDRKNIIDCVYQKAQGKQFSTWFYVLPYFQDYPWTYMFNWYGKNKYGYLPEKTGSFSPNDLKQSQYFFAIYEPDYDQPENLNKWLTEVNKNFGSSVGSCQSHDLMVELHRLQ